MTHWSKEIHENVIFFRKEVMSRLYIILLSISALAVSGIGATFSVSGLAKLFVGASTSVAFMAAALEFSKLVVAGFLYRYWGHVNSWMRAYLSLALIALVGITSMGIFGYLSNAYQKSSVVLKTHQMKVDNLQAENGRVLGEIYRIQKFINDVPRNRISKKFELQKEAEPQLRYLRKQSEETLNKISNLNVEMLHTQTKIGPLIYVAQALHTDVDTVAKYLILLFVSVFDPLAICLVFAIGLTIRLREKYRGNESRISANSMTLPVDHRFRKHRRVA